MRWAGGIQAEKKSFKSMFPVASKSYFASGFQPLLHACGTVIMGTSINEVGCQWFCDDNEQKLQDVIYGWPLILILSFFNKSVKMKKWVPK